MTVSSAFVTEQSTRTQMLNNTFKLTIKVNKSKVRFQLVVVVLIWNKRDSILVQVLKVVF